MSAHCDQCDADLVYTDEWPRMECPVCKRDHELKRLRDALFDVIGVVPAWWSDGDEDQRRIHSAATAAFAAAPTSGGQHG